MNNSILYLIIDILEKRTVGFNYVFDEPIGTGYMVTTLDALGGRFDTMLRNGGASHWRVEGAVQ